MKNTHMSTISVLALVSALQPAKAFDGYFHQVWDSFEQEMRMMQEHMHHMRQQIKSTFSTSHNGPSLSIDDSDKTKLVIALNNLKNEPRSAKLNQDKTALTISTDNGTLKISTRFIESPRPHTYIMLDARHSDTANNQESMMRSSMTYAVWEQVGLDSITIDYDESNARMTVTIPLQVKVEEIGTDVAINKVKSTAKVG